MHPQEFRGFMYVNAFESFASPTSTRNELLSVRHLNFLDDSGPCPSFLAHVIEEGHGVWVVTSKFCAALLPFPT